MIIVKMTRRRGSDVDKTEQRTLLTRVVQACSKNEGQSFPSSLCRGASVALVSAVRARLLPSACFRTCAMLGRSLKLTSQERMSERIV